PRVEAAPGVVHPDVDGEHAGRRIDRIRLPPGPQLADAVTAHAPIEHRAVVAAHRDGRGHEPHVPVPDAVGVVAAARGGDRVADEEQWPGHGVRVGHGEHDGTVDQLHVIVLPGGGYHRHAPHEGEPVAEWLRGLGHRASVFAYPVLTQHPGPLDAV